jgi:hypothetical protein
MNDEAKWTVFGNFIADKFFPINNRPDADSLIELLQDLDVPLEKIEALVERSATRSLTV